MGLSAVRSAWSFLTALGGSAAPEPSAPAAFGLVGAVVGAIVGLSWWLAAQWLPVTVAAAVLVVVDLGVTGMLHADGLADTADGLLPPRSRERRLEIMRAPDVGAFGVVALVAVFLLRWSAAGAQPVRWLVPAALWATARGLMAATIVTQPGARPGGMGTIFDGSARAGRVGAASGLVLGLVLGALAAGWRGVAAVGGVVVGGGLVVALARRRLGGYTGDVLGAAGLVGETVGLVVLSARR